MDLNPYKFEAPFEAYEFANFHLQAQTKLILCSMNWLYQTEKLTIEEQLSMSKVFNNGLYLQVHSSNLYYWFQRLMPLIAASETTNSKFTVVICNRIGHEKGL